MIRLWNTRTGDHLYDLRRVDKDSIYCLNFDPLTKYLCCSSVKGTVHIFTVNTSLLNKSKKPEEAKEEEKNEN